MVAGPELTAAPAPAAAASPARRALVEVARTMRGSLGSLRAAAETLEKLPGLGGAPRARLLAVIAEEAVRLGELVRRLEQLAEAPARASAAAAPGADWTVAELVARLAERAAGLGFVLGAAPPLEAGLAATPLALPGEEALAAAAGFLAELRRELAVCRLDLGARRADRHLLLDLRWSPEAADLPRLLDWHGAALDALPAAPAGAPRGLRPLARDHDGEAWFNLERDGGAAHVKVLLPLASGAAR